MNETTKLTRLELYNQVWSKPLIHLAKEFNISDVGLAKTCRRHNIPLPPVGYWARKAHGKHTQQIAFVPSKEGEAETIEIMAKTLSAANHVKGMSDDCIVELLGHEFIELKEFRKELHPLARESQKKYLSQLKLYKGLRGTERLDVDNFSVTRTSLDRACLAMSMLLQVFEANGLPVHRKEGTERGTYVRIHGVDIKFALKERTRRTERLDPDSYNKYEFHPTGILIFEVEDFYVHGARKIWSDTQLMKLEEMLNDVCYGFVVAAIVQKKRAQEIQERDRKWRIEEERRRLLEEQKRKELEKVNKLLEDAQQWHTANIVLKYVKAVEDSHASENTGTEVNTELEEWIKWAKQKAEILDPVQSRSWKTKTL